VTFINTYLGELLAAMALVVFSANVILTKIASARLSLDTGFPISVSVNVLFCLMLVGVELWARKEGPHWNTYGFCIFLVSGVFSTWLGRWFFFEAIVRFGPEKASVFQVSSPVFAVMIAWVALGERLTVTAMGGMVLALSGLMLVVYVPGIFRMPSRMPWATSFMRSSVCLGLGSSFAYAIGNVLRTSAIRSWNEPIIGALLGAAAGLALHVVLSTNTSNFLGSIRAADRKGIALYMISGVLTISAQICAIASLHFIPVGLSSLITLCSPVLVFPFSYWVFKNSEAITFRIVTGSIFVLTGIAIVVIAR